MATVKVFSTPTCTYCKQAKAFLTEKGIAFEDIDVSSSQLAAQEMIRKSNQMGVPVIEIDDQIIVGFNRSKLSQVLNLQ